MMTGTLLYEIWSDDHGHWVTLGTLTRGEQPGSITDMTGGGDRTVLLFRCEGDRSVVVRSAGGADFEIGPDRVVMPSGGLEVIAELGDGESCERDITSDALREYRARWTHRG